MGANSDIVETGTKSSSSSSRTSSGMLSSNRRVDRASEVAGASSMRNLLSDSGSIAGEWTDSAGEDAASVCCSSDEIDDAELSTLA